MLYRILMTDNFSKSSEDYIAKALKWNKVEGSSLGKMSYMFLDKTNFSIYTVIECSKLTFAALVGQNFNSTVYADMDNLDAEIAKKQSLAQLVKTIGAIHSANLIHGEIKPSNITVQMKAEPQFILSLPSFEISESKRIVRTKSYFSSVFGYSCPDSASSHYFDVMCFGYTLAAVFAENPLPAQYESSEEYRDLPEFVQSCISRSLNFIPEITMLMENLAI